MARWAVGRRPTGPPNADSGKNSLPPGRLKVQLPSDLLQELHLVDLVHRQLLAVLDLVQQRFMGLPVQEDHRRSSGRLCASTRLGVGLSALTCQPKANTKDRRAVRKNSVWIECKSHVPNLRGGMGILGERENGSLGLGRELHSTENVLCGKFFT